MIEEVETVKAIADENVNKENHSPEIDSKYRMILIAAKRSKQIQRGATPRTNLDNSKHKATKIAIKEVLENKVVFRIIDEE